MKDLMNLAPVLVAVIVPWLTFRFALRQEARRWSREQRSAVYEALLLEAYAEVQWYLHSEAQESSDKRLKFDDLRLSTMERARLGVRGTMFGSTEVNRRFNAIQTAILDLSLPSGEGGKTARRMGVQGAHDALVAQVRREFEPDRDSTKWSLEHRRSFLFPAITRTQR